jgi:hypothetical protein
MDIFNINPLYGAPPPPRFGPSARYAACRAVSSAASASRHYKSTPYGHIGQKPYDFRAVCDILQKNPPVVPALQS